MVIDLIKSSLEGEVKTYTVQEAGEILHISDEAVRRAIKRGDLRAKKVSRRWLIPHKALVEYLNS